MRLPLIALLTACSACTSFSTSKPDAMLDSQSDAMIDAPPCAPAVLFDGASAPAAQGWQVAQQEDATIAQGIDHVRLVTRAGNNGRGSQLVLYRPSTLPTNEPFTVQVELQVEDVVPHNPLDAAAAILASFTPPFGSSVERAQMVYLDGGALGWADDTQTYAAAITNGNYHTYQLSVDAARTLRVAIDGTPALSREGFTTNGTLAVGDQTNDSNLESKLRLRKITRVCL